jgi:crotonobetainyl-CoA:carnitine CoA-transferase CaiB-like acyl-CoA transferase
MSELGPVPRRVWQDRPVDAGADPAPLPALVEQAWAAVSGRRTAPVSFEVTGADGRLPSSFAVEDVAVACVGAALLAAGSLQQSRGGTARAAVVDRGQVAAAVRSERYFQLAGRPAGAGFATLSRFFEAGDGWVRTHANYPWHKRALLEALDASEDVDAVAAAIRRRPARDVETLVVEAGGVVAAVRTREEWDRHSQGRAVAAEPLVTARRVGEARPRTRPARNRPASGVRVLDLTRVIAGPVATRFLGALGADVLRVDPPRLPDVTPGAPADTLLGKRSAWLDASGPQGRAALHALLDEADVLVCGYRSGALDQLGLDAPSLTSAHPGLVVVVLNAWGHAGPWAGRRGFDSLVQAASGIAAGESPDGQAPGALPCQLLDHGTGYLMAAAALDGLRCQAEHGGTHFRYLSLAQTASWLMSAGPRVPTRPDEPDDGADWMVELEAPDARVRAVGPPGRLDDQLLAWPPVVSRYGADEPVWLPARTI